MVFLYLQLDPALSAGFDEAGVDAQAVSLGPEVVALWQAIKTSARQTADQADQ